MLILQHRYVEAEVLLEALTRLEHGGDVAGANAEETRGRQEGRPGDWSCRHSSEPLSRTATVIQPSKQVHTLPWLRKQFIPVDYSPSRTIAWKNHDNQVTYSVTKSRGQQSANQRELSTKQSQYLHLAPLSASAIVTTSSKSVNQSTAFDVSIWPKGRKHQPHPEPQIMNSLNTLPKNRLPQKSELRSGSRQLAASLLLIDVHHQMALLYTLTNRSDEVSKTLTA